MPEIFQGIPWSTVLAVAGGYGLIGLVVGIPVAIWMFKEEHEDSDRFFEWIFFGTSLVLIWPYLVYCAVQAYVWYPLRGAYMGWRWRRSQSRN